MRLEARGLSLAVDGVPLVNGADCSVEAGTLTALVGPNGAGKTSLLRLLLALTAADSGRVTIDGTDMETLSPAERARRCAYLPQARPLVWPQPVRDIVALGRFAYGASPGRLGKDDAKAVALAIAECGLDHLADRAADTLSGGELARVHLARAFAAETPLLIADEPVAALDPRYQHDVMRLFVAAARSGRTVLTVVHDLALAARYADQIMWMKDGRIVAAGPPAETLDAERLRDLFGVDAKVDRAADGGWLIDIRGPA